MYVFNLLINIQLKRRSYPGKRCGVFEGWSFFTILNLTWSLMTWLLAIPCFHKLNILKITRLCQNCYLSSCTVQVLVLVNSF